MSTTVLTLPSHMAGFLHELGPASGVYSFVSYPSAIMPNRPKYRSEQPPSGSSSTVNIMHDRRVVRGNTYAANHRIPMHRAWGNNVQSTDDDIMKQRQNDRRTYVRRRVLPNISGGRNGAGPFKGEGELRADKLLSSEARYTAARARVRKRLAHFQDDIAPVEGRKHSDIQTEKWLEEIKDRTLETEVAVQTDDVSFSSRPPTPREAFQTPPGADKATQILPDDPELFVFDEEVGIVLEALVGKTLEQSLLEVIEEEEELAAISKMKLEDEKS